jgi:hypothetical protein
VSLTGIGITPTPGPQLAVSPATLDFGSVVVNASADRSFTLTNAGGETLTGSASTAAPFSIVAGASFSLEAGQSQTVTVRFSPTTAGTFNGSVSVSSNGGNATVSLTGIGITPTPGPQLAVSPATLDFGTVTPGTSRDLSLTVTNGGGETLTGNVSTVAPFSIVSGGTFSLGAGQSQMVMVRFSPTAFGPVSGSANVTSNGGDVSVTLSGVGSSGGSLSLACQQLLVGAACGTLETSGICVSLRIPDGSACQGSCAEAVANTLRAEGITVIGPSGNLGPLAPGCVGFRPDIGGTLEGAQCLADLLGPDYQVEDPSSGRSCRTDGFPYNVLTGPAAPPASVGSVSGVVRNAFTEAAILGAAVRVASGPTMAPSVTTNSNGAYTFSGLAPGSYLLEASASGFQSSQQNVTVVSEANTTIDFDLSPIPAQLSLRFEPNPASPSFESNLFCPGGIPNWDFRGFLTETAGGRVTITRFTWDFYDSLGIQTGTQTNTATDFADFFNNCGSGSTSIPPLGTVCGDLCVQLGGRSSGSVVMTFYGVDDTGQEISVSAREFLSP